MYKSITWFMIGYVFHKNFSKITAKITLNLEEKLHLSPEPEMVEKAPFDAFHRVIMAKGDAEDLQNKMHDIMRESGVVYLSDYLAAAGLSHTYLDERWGWPDQSRFGTGIIEHADGYYVEMPEPKKL